MKEPLLTVDLRTEPDVVYARQRARLVAEMLGFELQDQTRIATAVSEVARNALEYARGGRIRFFVDVADAITFRIEVADRGGGIPHLDEILEGRYRSKTGMGVGLLGAKKLMDTFAIETTSEGTTVQLGKRRQQKGSPPTLDVARITAGIARQPPQSPFEEVRLQNQELLRALDVLKEREEELTRVNHELAETNTGVVALYAELEEKAAVLRASTEAKARFHSQMSHEVRTPINSILSLSEILLNGTVTAPLPAQEKPLTFIRKAAQQLSALVDDLLDLAKVEAGKMVVRTETFRVVDLFGALRGMFRPLHTESTVLLAFDDVRALPAMRGDEGKISQILRNFISNALKFTEEGHVRVSAVLDGDDVVFSVADTGIGIAPEDLGNLFQDFGQIESPQQKKVKGTGLGLSLSRHLAELLGGSVSVTSTKGEGSTFRLVVPRVAFDVGGAKE